MTAAEVDTAGHIAVVGMAGRFPGAADVDQYWANLVGGVESLTVFPTDGPADHVPTAGVLDAADQFDAAFFGCSPAEALILDPQHRLFLECAWEALEDAGVDTGSYPGVIGIWGGSTESGYLERLRSARDRLPAGVSDFQLKIATGIDFLTSRVAYKLGLQGPAVTVQTACSTSLVAIHAAAQALLGGECDVAMAGGATVPATAEPGDYDEGGIVSQDGHCRTFDADAGGTVSGSGVGIVVLKRLADAIADGDAIRAVLLGSATNNDGSMKVGFAAPGVDGQAQVIRAAQLVADVEADSVTYVEAHGTATALGDPIEVAALTKAFRLGTDRRGFCLLGSVKTNIGHADAAAGVAGFIKAVLAVEHGLVPPSLHFRRPNPALDLERSPFRVNQRLEQWQPAGFPRRAGVSAFGIGGTNAHAILQEPPTRCAEPSTARQLLVLSARTAPALEAATTRLGQHLADHPELPLTEVAWTLQTGRKAHRHRRFVVCGSTQDAARALTVPDGDRVHSADRDGADRPVVFLFPGQGGQHVGMGRELYDSEPVFREIIDVGCDVAAPALGLDLRTVLYPPTGDDAAAATSAARLRRMSVGQPAVLIVEYALARLWMSWGITPAAVVGHSLGAFAAACVAGVLDLPDAVRLVVERGRLLDTLPPGAMLAVPLSEDRTRPLVGGSLSLAAINGPTQSVVSGPTEAIERLQQQLAADGVDARRLNISTAGHSTLVEPIADAFGSAVAGIALRDPVVPLLSDTTGAWTGPGDLTTPEYWMAHLRGTVRFGDALSVLLAEPDRVLLEVGPGRTLATLARQHPALDATHEVVQSLPHPSDPTSEATTMLTAAGRLWLAGAPVSWPGLHQGQRRGKVRLPTYPFERRRFSIDAPTDGPTTGEPATADAVLDDAAIGRAATGAATRASIRPMDPVEHTVEEIFRQVLGVTRLTAHSSFFDLGGDSLIAAQLMVLVSRAFSVQLPARTIYRAPTVSALASLVRDSMNAGTAAALPASVEGEKRGGSADSGRWLTCRQRRPDAGHRLYCFPHSGGAAGEFVRWADELPAVEVLGVQLPGRGARLAETPFTRMAPLVDAILADVSFDGPFAFFGHSLGALVAFEVARALRLAGREQPVRIFASACPAPDLARSGAAVHRLSDSELAAWIAREYGSMPAGVLDDPDLLRIVIPAHRADFELVDSYRYRDAEPLGSPITVIGGTDDDIPAAELTGWDRHTAAGCELDLLPGGHFYLREQQHDLLRLVGNRLQSGPVPAREHPALQDAAR